MKAILTNWIVEVHQKFGLKLKSLFIALNLIERVLAIKTIKKKEFQLLGVSCLFIASKFEDIYAPELDELCYLCDSAYTKEEILRMESFVLSSLNFEIVFVSVQDVLEQFFLTLNLRNENLQEMSFFLAKSFLFQSYLSKYNVYKLAAFIIEESQRLLSQKSKPVYGIVTEQETGLLQQKL